MIGTEIGSYKLISRLGAGGMGEVYVGQHTLLGRKAAVKVLLEEWSKDERVVHRFINEARATSKLVHPGIIRIHDFGTTPDGKAYMLMELLEGETLDGRLAARGRLALPEAVAIARQLADALALAHSNRVVHRDLKPENVFLVRDPRSSTGEQAKILDFGIAKMLDPAAGAPRTQTGSILGTPVYMSPEQCAGQKVDHRADVYSLGCVFFHMLCGRPPFDMEGIGQLLGAHLYTPPPSPTSVAPELPATLDALLLKLLAKKPDERYESMPDFIAALDALGLGPPPAKVTQNALTSAERRVLAASPAEASAPTVAADAIAPAGAATLVQPAGAVSIEPPTIAAPTSAPAPARKEEVTTLGASTGEVGKTLIPQPERAQSNAGTIMIVAFGLTVAAALGGFFLFGRKAPIAATPVGETAPATASFTIDSDPPGAEVWVDGNRAGTTPYVDVQAAKPGERHFILKMSGFDEKTISLPSDKGGKEHVVLTAAVPH